MGAMLGMTESAVKVTAVAGAEAFLFARFGIGGCWSCRADSYPTPNQYPENLRLQQRGEVVARENERLAQLGTAAEELERLRTERAELLRLRGELAVLRREQQASIARKPFSSQPATAGQAATQVS